MATGVTSIVDEVDDAPLCVEAVYRQHAKDVARWVQRLLGHSNDVSDLVHDIFCIVHQRLREFSPRTAKLTTWLFRITENVVHNHRRRQHFRALLFKPLELAQSVFLSEDTPERWVSSKNDIARVYKVMNKLPEKQRTLLILFEIEGLSGDAISEMTGTKISTVWVQLHRARAAFLIELQKQELRS